MVSSLVYPATLPHFTDAHKSMFYLLKAEGSLARECLSGRVFA